MLLSKPKTHRQQTAEQHVESVETGPRQVLTVRLELDGVREKLEYDIDQLTTVLHVFDRLQPVECDLGKDEAPLVNELAIGETERLKSRKH